MKLLLVVTTILIYCFSENFGASCDQFFQGQSWPLPNFVNTSKQDVVKLCQTDYGKNFTYYATLFSTTDKIPIYSANVVNINRNQTTHRRPKNSLWKRVATTLCNATHLSPDVYYSEIGRPENNSCETLQALNDDYKNNKLGLVRGHLNPNSINKRFRAKQKATFTLTNAAPQFKYFNQLWWSVVECITEQTILDWAQNEDVYVMTGTFGKGNPSKLNSVTVPEFYWKAVCYPGNETTNTQAFGYAIMRPNVRKSQRFFFKNYTTLEAFTKKMFSIDSPPFGNNCTYAGYGRFQTLEKNDIWEDYLRKCSAPKN